MERAHVGDAPDDPGPLATDISAELKPKAISAAMKKVGDWQVKVAEPKAPRPEIGAVFAESDKAKDDGKGAATTPKKKAPKKAAAAAEDKAAEPAASES